MIVPTIISDTVNAHPNGFGGSAGTLSPLTDPLRHAHELEEHSVTRRK